MAEWNPEYSTSSSVMSLNSSKSFVLSKPTLKMEKLKMCIRYNGILCAVFYENRIFHDWRNPWNFAIIGPSFSLSLNMELGYFFVLPCIDKSIINSLFDAYFSLMSLSKQMQLLSIRYTEGDFIYNKRNRLNRKWFVQKKKYFHVLASNKKILSIVLILERCDNIIKFYLSNKFLLITWLFIAKEEISSHNNS